MATYTESTQKYGIVVSEGGTAKLIGEVETLFVREDARESERKILYMNFYIFCIWSYCCAHAVAT